MSKSPKSSIGITVFLFTLGLSLIVISIIVLLRGLGILPSIPSFVVWSLVLLTLGIGIIAGISSRNNT